MKLKRLEDNKIIEILDENAAKRFLGYPDLFEEIKEAGEPKTKGKKEE